MIFILTCLTVWRICHFIAREDGPWYFMWAFREWVYFKKWYGLFELLTCVKCSSVWVSYIFVPFCFPNNQFLSWLAVSAAVCLLEALHGMLRGERPV